MDKPCSPACERNRDPILEVIRPELADSNRVLEIGSGTGQHAVHFAAAMPHLNWQPSDRESEHAGINRWIADSGLPNVLPPLTLDVTRDGDWPTESYDAAYTANTCHIVAWPGVLQMVAGVARVLRPGSPWLVYGPFNRDGKFTSTGNRDLDRWARATFPGGGLRDQAAVIQAHEQGGFALEANRAMPANNRILVFRLSQSNPG